MGQYTMSVWLCRMAEDAPIEIAVEDTAATEEQDIISQR